MLISPIFQMLGDQWASLFDKCRDLKMMLKNGHQNVTKVTTSIVIRGCGGFADSERCTIFYQLYKNDFGIENFKTIVTVSQPGGLTILPNTTPCQIEAELKDLHEWIQIKESETGRAKVSSNKKDFFTRWSIFLIQTSTHVLVFFILSCKITNHSPHLSLFPGVWNSRRASVLL